MILPLINLIYAPISFYRMPNNVNRSNNARRQQRMLQKDRQIFKTQLFALVMLIIGVTIRKCFLVVKHEKG